MYSFRQIRDAILEVSAQGGASPSFPYGEKTDELLEKVRREPHLQQVLAEIREEARRAAKEPLEPLSFAKFQLFETTGTRKEYEVPYFDRRRRLLGLTLATVIDDTDEHIEALQDLIWEICSEYTWSLPAHLPVGMEAVRSNHVPPEQVVDLFAAETAHALAETLYLAGSRMKPWMEYRIREEIERRAFRPVFHDPVHFGWESQPMNWASVCSGALGMAALLLEKDAERLAGMMERVLRAMECFLEGFGEDGGCAEGIGYWIYGFGYYTYFAEMLDAYTGGRLNMLKGAKLKRIAAFPLGASLAAERFVSYSDADERSELRTGLISRLAHRFGLQVPEMLSVSSLHSDHCYRWAHATRDLFWTDPELLNKPTPAGQFYFEDLQWLIDRRRLSDTFVGFSAKGGHNGEPHNHNDLGNFILNVGGESLLCDLGAGVYTRDYFGSKRYTYLHNASEGHSVPLIDGKQQQAGRERCAKLLELSTDNGAARFGLDLTEAYALPELKRLERRFVWSTDEAAREALLLLDDRFEFAAAPGALEEAFISRREPVIEGGRITWTGAGGAVALDYDPTAWSARLETIETRNHHLIKETVYRIRLTALQPAADMRFAGRFTVRV